MYNIIAGIVMKLILIIACVKTENHKDRYGFSLLETYGVLTVRAEDVVADIN